MNKKKCDCCGTNSSLKWFSNLYFVLKLIWLIQAHFNPDGMDLHPIYPQLCKLILHMCIFGI